MTLCRVGICTTHVGAGFFRCERPFGASASGFALSLPCADLGDGAVGVVDPSVRALASQDTDLDFDHVKSAGVLGGVVDRKMRRASEDLEAW
jgi:hypothetical protein